MDEQVRILLCEDEENLGTILKELLESKHYKVDLCADGEQGWKAFRLHKYDLCLLDIMMPKRDGLTLAKDIRSMRDDVPIIFLTALGMRENILEAKHDAEREPQRIYYIGGYTFNTTNQTLTFNEQSRRLTTKECELLSLLCLFANQTLERAYALNVIWGITEPSGANENSFSQRSMDVYVTKLRRMLADDPSIEIKNVHGKGYKLVIPPVAAPEEH